MTCLIILYGLSFIIISCGIIAVSLTIRETEEEYAKSIEDYEDWVIKKYSKNFPKETPRSLIIWEHKQYMSIRNAIDLAIYGGGR